MANETIHVVLASLLLGTVSCGGNEPSPSPGDAGRWLDAASLGPPDAGELADHGVELTDAAPASLQDAADGVELTDAAPASPQDAADSARCEPACESGSSCCTDEHGHFPRCVAGAECP